jgi:hypothetical protein
MKRNKKRQNPESLSAKQELSKKCLGIAKHTLSISFIHKKSRMEVEHE